MKKFKVAEIVPVAQLGAIVDNHYHMCLAHLVKGNGSRNKTYTSFYRRMSDEGKYVLMDNGAAEGEQLCFDELVNMYSLIKPTEIVLPDTLNDSVDTLRKTLSFIHRYSRLPYKFMAVPQGKDFQEWCDCCKIMMRMPRINSIGVSKFLNVATGNPMIRHDACAFIDVMIKTLGRNDIEVHLLGCDEGPAIVKAIQKQYPFVRACDSAFAYIATNGGVKITEQMQRPAGEIDFLNGYACTNYKEQAKLFEEYTGVKDGNNGFDWSWK